MFSVIYYKYYLFYKRVLKEKDPYITAVLSFSFAQSLLINAILKMVLAYFYCLSYGKWGGIGIVIFLIFINYIFYIRKKNGQRIVEAAPEIFGSHVLSVLLTVIFTCVAISFMFYGADWEIYMLEKCGSSPWEIF